MQPSRVCENSGVSGVAATMRANFEPQIEVLRGEQITPHLKELGELFSLYEVYPTFYRSSGNNANHFVKIQQLNDHVVIIAKDPGSGKIIGFIPANPLNEGYPRYRVAFPNEKFPDRTYHIRDLIVHPDYRNRQVGSTLYKALEKHAKASGNYGQISVAITLRDDDFFKEHPHLQKPANAPYEHAVWEKLGFKKYEEGNLYHTDWTLVGEDTPSANAKQFWMKSIN